jgi:two-component system cell cycle sensor histidine kinase/response regulator CckA
MTRLLPPGSVQRDLSVVCAALVIALVVQALYLAFFHLPAQRAEAEEHIREDLSLVVDDRTRALEMWVRERIANVRVASSYVAAAMAQPRGTRGPELYPMLDNVVKAYGYEAVYVVDETGRIISRSRETNTDETCVVRFASLVHAGGAPFVDFCADSRNRPKVLSAAKLPPIGSSPSAGSLVFLSDPYAYIYPAIASWPASSSGETRLDRIEGDHVRILTPTRVDARAPLTMRRPLSETSVGAYLRQGPSIRHVDRRNVPVFGEVRKIAGTPWYLLTKIDQSEALAPARAGTRHLAEVMALLTLVIAGGTFALLRSRRMSELRAAEENFRRLFENTTNGILVCELIFDESGKPIDHRLIRANPACERLIGIDAASNIGARGADMVVRWPPDLLARVYDVAMTGKQIEYERYNDSFGRWYETRVFSPRKGEFAHVFTEITARKHAEAMIRALSDDSLLGVFSCEGDVVTYINDAALAMFGYRRDEIIGADPMSIVHPDDRERVAEHIRQRLAGEVGSETYTFRGRRKDGSPCWIEAAVNPVTREGRKMIIGNLIDVTERANAESALQRLAIAVSQLDEGIVITDPKGIVQYINPAFEHLTGFTYGEVIGKRWSLLERDPQLAAAMMAAAHRGEVWQGIVRSTRKNGSTLEQDITVSPVRDLRGAIVNLVAVKRDITKERSLVAQLMQAQKMEAIGVLAGGVAHDFNNLLQGMSMMVQIAERRSCEPERLAAAHAELSRLVQRAVGVTRQLLLFSRKEVAKPERLDLNDAIRDASKLLRRLLRENIAFRIVLDPGQLPVTVDRGQIEQALVNLVVNAADAMTKGGRIELRTEGNDETCRIVVQDNGHGIPAAIRDRVFEPFFTTKGKDKGTGLGLSVVHGIVTEHGGTVHFEDVEGGGTRFCITLPRTESLPDAADAAESRTPLPKGNGERILVIEDEESVRAGLGAMLELLEYAPVMVGSGAAALQQPQDAPFDVALCDVVLPDTHGPVVARELSRRWPRMKTILMSGYNSDAELQREAAAGSVTLLEKPFDMENLARTLRATLDEHAS